MFDPPARIPVPTIYNLFTGPREETPTPATSVAGQVLESVSQFQERAERHPLIPMGTPDPSVPKAAR